MKNKKTKKIIILIILIIVLFIVIGTVCYFVNSREELKDNNEKDNAIDNIDEEENIIPSEQYEITEDEVINSQEISKVLFDNIEYKFDGISTIINFDVINNNAQEVILHKMKFEIYDKDNNLICTFEPIYEKKLKKDDKINLGLETRKDCKEASKLKIILPELEYIEK